MQYYGIYQFVVLSSNLTPKQSKNIEIKIGHFFSRVNDPKLTDSQFLESLVPKVLEFDPLHF